MWSEAFATVPWLPAENNRCRHHHEYLDGTGYPHRLKGSEISDSIFAALVERRSNRPPLASEAAYQVLLNMGRKLDRESRSRISRHLPHEVVAYARLPFDSMADRRSEREQARPDNRCET